jgi:hypothetical protein
MATRIPCTACVGILGPAKARCHECRGVGYTERTECPAKGKAFLTECAAFLSRDPMCGGWECSRCHESGPL